MQEIAATPIENFHRPLDGEWSAEGASWFAVYTSSRHEKCVAKHFGERNIENFLPLYGQERQWNKRSNIRLELPLFPNYVFVRIWPKQRVPVLCVPGVLGIVGGRTPSALPDAEIEALRAGLALRRIEPHPYLVEGEQVRIRRGALAGMEGILLRHKNELRVVLTIALIQRSVAAEVDAKDVEPIYSRPNLKSPESFPC